jgi:hypothetical protein
VIDGLDDLLEAADSLGVRTKLDEWLTKVCADPSGQGRPRIIGISRGPLGIPGFEKSERVLLVQVPDFGSPASKPEVEARAHLAAAVEKISRIFA